MRQGSTPTTDGIRISIHRHQGGEGFGSRRHFSSRACVRVRIGGATSPVLGDG